MAEIDVERTDENKRKKNNNWWVWVVVAIIAILIAWIALSNRNEVTEDETRPEPVITMVKV